MCKKYVRHALYNGYININGGLENNGSALIADDESNCFVYAGMDLQKSYKRHGIANLPVSDNVKLINQRKLPENTDLLKKYYEIRKSDFIVFF